MYQQMREMSQITGPAADRLFGDVVALVDAARSMTARRSRGARWGSPMRRLAVSTGYGRSRTGITSACICTATIRQLRVLATRTWRSAAGRYSRRRSNATDSPSCAAVDASTWIWEVEWNGMEVRNGPAWKKWTDQGMEDGMEWNGMEWNGSIRIERIWTAATIFAISAAHA